MKVDETSRLFWTLQFNFVGKLLGPKGNSMKRLQEETMCKMAVLGRGSMKDRQKVRSQKKKKKLYTYILIEYCI